MAMWIQLARANAWLRRRWQRWRDHRSGHGTVSASWLRAQSQAEGRLEFHGPAWSWPLNKVLNEAGRWNRSRLRRGRVGPTTDRERA